MPAASPAPRAPDEGFALVLTDSPFSARFSYDYPARTWRSREGGTPVPLAQVIHAATGVLRQAILDAAPDLPLPLRCVFADDDRVDLLDAVTDWPAAREREADRQTGAALDASLAALAVYDRRAAAHAECDRLRAIPESARTSEEFDRLRRLAMTPHPGRRPTLPQRPVAPEDVVLVTPRQRERVLRALSLRGVDAAVRRASGMPSCVHEGTGTSTEFERTWLRSLPRVPGAVTLSSALRAAYLDALPADAHPMSDKAFHAIAVEELGGGDRSACRTKRRGHVHYRDVVLVAPEGARSA